MGFDGGAGAMKWGGNGRENMSLWWGTHPPYFGINAGGPIYRGILGHISRDNNGEMAPKYAPRLKKVPGWKILYLWAHHIPHLEWPITPHSTVYS